MIIGNTSPPNPVTRRLDCKFDVLVVYIPYLKVPALLSTMLMAVLLLLVNQSGTTLMPI